MKESNSNSKNDIQKMSRLKKFGILRDFSCFGAHGELSVLLRNLKFYFDIKPKNEEIADAILRVILCNLKHVIDLCNICSQNQDLSFLLTYEKNTWQFYKNLKAPYRIKQLYLEMEVSEYLLIENYKKLKINAEKSKSERIEELIVESKECLELLHKLTKNDSISSNLIKI